LPALARQSFTFDRGKEFAGFSFLDLLNSPSWSFPMLEVPAAIGKPLLDPGVKADFC
jgi:hypothetical protein